MRVRDAAIAAGLVAGYLVQVVQNTAGPGYAFHVGRFQWGDHWKRVAESHGWDDAEGIQVGGVLKPGQLAQSVKHMADCGWCLAPYVAVPIFLVMAGRGHKVRRLVAGAGVATAVAGIYRHLADMF